MDKDYQIKCVIIEDNYLTAMSLSRMVEELGYEVLANLQTKEEVDASIELDNADVILSDVKLDVETFAFDVLKDCKDSVPIILFSSHVDLDLYNQCKKLNPYIYLIKPIDKLTLRSAVEGALSNKRSKSVNDLKVEGGKVFVKTKGKLISVDPRDVLFIESEGNYCYINMVDRKIVIRSSLSAILTTFNSKLLIQTQRGYIVNIDKIQDVDITRDFIVLGDHTIPIGRKYKKKVLDHIKGYS